MKKILLFAILFSLLAGFSSCSNDEENDPFIWEGDIEGYNPLLGVWMFENNTSNHLEFSKEKILYRLIYNTSGQGGVQTIKIGPFEINNKAYKTNLTGITRYKLDGDRLTQYPNQNNDDNSSILIRVK